MENYIFFPMYPPYKIVINFFHIVGGEREMGGGIFTVGDEI